MQHIGGVLGNQRQLKVIAPRLVAMLTGHLPAIPDGRTPVQYRMYLPEPTHAD